MATKNDRGLAVVTGASSGIGLALARECAANGFGLIICAEDFGVTDAATLLAGEGVAVQAVQQDLRTAEGVEALAREVHAAGRPLEALLLNAGVGVGGAFVETSLREELDMIALNCNHTVHLAKRLIPEMVKRGKGRVLITGSILSTAPAPYAAVYGATKAFVMSFGEALAHELKDTGVTVTVLQPAATDTEFFARADMEDTKVGRGDKDDPADVARRGFQAMMDGKTSVLGGDLMGRVEGLMNEVLPESVKAAQVAKSNKPLRGGKA